jgi:hypothetical protein
MNYKLNIINFTIILKIIIKNMIILNIIFLPNFFKIIINDLEYLRVSIFNYYKKNKNE